MTHKVTMTVELTIEAPENKTKEDVEGFAYWLLEPHIEEMITSAYDFDGFQTKGFNIEINKVMEALYVVYEATKLGMMPTAYSSNKKTADCFASKRGVDSVVLSEDAEKVEQTLKRLRIKNLDI